MAQAWASLVFGASPSPSALFEPSPRALHQLQHPVDLDKRTTQCVFLSPTPSNQPSSNDSSLPCAPEFHQPAPAPLPEQQKQHEVSGAAATAPPGDNSWCTSGGASQAAPSRSSTSNGSSPRLWDELVNSVPRATSTLATGSLHPASPAAGAAAAARQRVTVSAPGTKPPQQQQESLGSQAAAACIHATSTLESRLSWDVLATGVRASSAPQPRPEAAAPAGAAVPSLLQTSASAPFHTPVPAPAPSPAPISLDPYGATGAAGANAPAGVLAQPHWLITRMATPPASPLCPAAAAAHCSYSPHLDPAAPISSTPSATSRPPLLRSDQAQLVRNGGAVCEWSADPAAVSISRVADDEAAITAPVHLATANQPWEVFSHEDLPAFSACGPQPTPPYPRPSAAPLHVAPEQQKERQQLLVPWVGTVFCEGPQSSSTSPTAQQLLAATASAPAPPPSPFQHVVLASSATAIPSGSTPSMASPPAPLQRCDAQNQVLRNSCSSAAWSAATATAAAASSPAPLADTTRPWEDLPADEDNNTSTMPRMQAATPPGSMQGACPLTTLSPASAHPSNLARLQLPEPSGDTLPELGSSSSSSTPALQRSNQAQLPRNGHGSGLDNWDASAAAPTPSPRPAIATAATAAAPNSPDPFTTIHPSELTYRQQGDNGNVLGFGSFGQVLLASWQGKPVAVKTLISPACRDVPFPLAEASSGADDATAFMKEVVLMSRLRHTNVVQFLGVVAEPHHLALVTEFAPRGSLYRVLHDPSLAPKLSPRRRLQMAKDVVAGMLYLHSRHVVHRDLKTPNLLVFNDWTVKVCDFGLTRIKHNALASLRFSNRFTPPGTIGYMAPELIKGATSYSEKVDVYSFGVVLWELATGLRPWDGLPAPAVMFKCAQGMCLEIPADLHPVLRDLLASCWDMNPVARPSFREILEVLEGMNELRPAAAAAAAPPAAAAHDDDD